MGTRPIVHLQSPDHHKPPLAPQLNEFSTSTCAQVVYDGAVTSADLESWNSDLEELFARMGPVFYRTESRRHAEQ